MPDGLLPALKPIPIKERVSVFFVEKVEIDVLDGVFVVIDVTGGVGTLCSPRAWG